MAMLGGECSACCTGWYCYTCPSGYDSSLLEFGAIQSADFSLPLTAQPQSSGDPPLSENSYPQPDVLWKRMSVYRDNYSYMINLDKKKVFGGVMTVPLAQLSPAFSPGAGYVEFGADFGGADPYRVQTIADSEGRIRIMKFSTVSPYRFAAHQSLFVRISATEQCTGPKRQVTTKLFIDARWRRRCIAINKDVLVAASLDGIPLTTWEQWQSFAVTNEQLVSQSPVPLQPSSGGWACISTLENQGAYAIAIGDIPDFDISMSYNPATLVSAYC